MIKRLGTVLLVVAVVGLWLRPTPAVSQSVGYVHALQDAPGPFSAPWFVSLVPNFLGGCTPKAYTAQTTTVQTVKATAGILCGYYMSNAANAAVSCVQLFDRGGNSLATLGTTTPNAVIELNNNAMANVELPTGGKFVNGIQMAAATTCTGSTAPGSGLNLTLWVF